MQGNEAPAHRPTLSALSHSHVHVATRERPELCFCWRAAAFLLLVEPLRAILYSDPRHPEPQAARAMVQVPEKLESLFHSHRQGQEGGQEGHV